jgi:3-isopropylmalate dehydrogenase
MTQARIVLLPGDGIGPEVISAAVQVLDCIAAAFNHVFAYEEQLIGGCAIDSTGTALPDQTLRACRQADAILLGAVGGPAWDDPAATVRPEQGLLGIRKALELYANLRPVRVYLPLQEASPLRLNRLEGVDILVLRELTGGLYFGQPRLRRQVDGEQEAVDTMTYRQSEVRRVAHLAFQLARQRRGKVSSVDKANVLECSRLWRQTVIEAAREYPDVLLEHVLVDAAAMFLITRPASFDVLLTENMFGDILSDEASVISGSMGNLPSASLGAGKNRLGYQLGLFEPAHGSAPDIAGRGIANPLGTILSAAMMLRYSLGLEREAQAVESAVELALADGQRTIDLLSPEERNTIPESALSTREMAEAIVSRIRQSDLIGG